MLRRTQRVATATARQRHEAGNAMKLTFFSSLRVRLLLLVLLAVVPALGLILYSAAEERQCDRDRAERDALRLVESSPAIMPRWCRMPSMC